MSSLTTVRRCCFTLKLRDARNAGPVVGLAAWRMSKLCVTDQFCPRARDLLLYLIIALAHGCSRLP